MKIKVNSLGIFFTGVAIVGLLMGSAGVVHSAKPLKALVFITNPEGTSWYRAAVAQSHLIGKHTDLKISVQPTAGTKVNAPMVQRGEGQICITSSTHGREEYKGIGKRWAGKPHPCMRALMIGHPLLYGFVTRRDSDIHTIPDLRGKRVVIKLLGKIGQELVGMAELKAYGMDPEKDLHVMKASHSKEAMEMLKEKRVHAYASMVREPATAVLDQAVGARVLPIDRDKVPAIQAKLPGYSAQILPAGMPGAERDTLMVGTFSILYARHDVPDDVVYVIVKTLMEYQKELAPIHADFRFWTMERTVDLATQVEFPFHPGAIKYLKERNIWTEEMQKQSDNMLRYHKKR